MWTSLHRGRHAVDASSPSDEVSGPSMNRFGPRRGRAAAVELRLGASATSPRWRAGHGHAVDATPRRRRACHQRVYASRESLGTAERLETAQTRERNTD